ncbi:MAG: hypothetical protein ACOX05_04340 [Bacillota bacterium]
MNLLMVVTLSALMNNRIMSEGMFSLLLFCTYNEVNFPECFFAVKKSFCFCADVFNQLLTKFPFIDTNAADLNAAGGIVIINKSIFENYQITERV